MPFSIIYGLFEDPFSDLSGALSRAKAKVLLDRVEPFPSWTEKGHRFIDKRLDKISELQELILDQLDEIENPEQYDDEVDPTPVVLPSYK